MGEKVIITLDGNWLFFVAGEKIFKKEDITEIVWKDKHTYGVWAPQWAWLGLTFKKIKRLQLGSFICEYTPHTHFHFMHAYTLN